MRDSPIQLCDDTINPVMGCDGCELAARPGDWQAKTDQSADVASANCQVDSSVSLRESLVSKSAESTPRLTRDEAKDQKSVLSERAKKAWETRRKKMKASQAAEKAWETRRNKGQVNP